MVKAQLLLFFSIFFISSNCFGQFGEKNIISQFAKPIPPNYNLSYYDDLKIHYADLDNDIDFVYLHNFQNSSYISILLNNGANFYDTTVIATFDSYIMDILPIDVDNDLDFDIVYVKRFGNEVNWIENLGNNNFGPKSIIDNTSFIFVKQKLDTCDFNNDNLTDLFFADEGGTLRWIKNLGGGNFDTSIIIKQGYNTIPMPNYVTTYCNVFTEFSDMDNNGFKDIISATRLAVSTDTISVEINAIILNYNDGLGNFTIDDTIHKFESNIKDIEVGDINLDGKNDILVFLFNTDLYWIENLGNSNYSNPIEIKNFNNNVYFNTIRYQKTLFLEDIDNDGDKEIIGVNFEEDNIIYLENYFNHGQKIEGNFYHDINQNTLFDGNEIGKKTHISI